MQMNAIKLGNIIKKQNNIVTHPVQKNNNDNTIAKTLCSSTVSLNSWYLKVQKCGMKQLKTQYGIKIEQQRWMCCR